METNEKIKMLRTNLGMTLDDIGEIVGVSGATVQRWENGIISNMRKDKIAKLAEALQTTPDYLMGWSDTIGDRIRTRRTQMGLTQAELADKLGYTSKSAIAKIETGVNQLTQEQIMPFANALNTTPSYIMGWDKKPKNRIRQLRESLGLTQEELGQMVGVQRAAINKYETGAIVNLKRSTIEKLARALKTTEADVMGLDKTYTEPVKLSDSIKQLRIEKGYTQTELSVLLGKKSYTTITKWESGLAEPSVSDLYRLAEIFNCSIMDILNHKDIEIKKDNDIDKLVKKYKKLDNHGKQLINMIIDFELKKEASE